MPLVTVLWMAIGAHGAGGATALRLVDQEPALEAGHVQTLFLKMVARIVWVQTWKQWDVA